MWDVEAELPPDRRYSVRHEVKDACLQQWPYAVVHGVGPRYCRDQRSGEHVGVEHQQRRLELLAETQQVVEHECHPDLAEEPGHEVALHPRRLEPIAGQSPRPGAQRAEPGTELRTGRTKRKSLARDSLRRVRSAGNYDVIALGFERLGEREQGQDVTCLRHAADNDPHRASPGE